MRALDFNPFCLLGHRLRTEVYGERVQTYCLRCTLWFPASLIQPA